MGRVIKNDLNLGRQYKSPSLAARVLQRSPQRSIRASPKIKNKRITKSPNNGTRSRRNSSEVISSKHIKTVSVSQQSQHSKRKSEGKEPLTPIVLDFDNVETSTSIISPKRDSSFVKDTD